jgi:hypothetical protein
MGHSPPANANEILISDIQQKVNDLGMNWVDLDDDKRAKISFLVLRNQHGLLQTIGHNINVPPGALSTALDANTPYRKRLEAFV